MCTKRSVCHGGYSDGSITNLISTIHSRSSLDYRCPTYPKFRGSKTSCFTDGRLICVDRIDCELSFETDATIIEDFPCVNQVPVLSLRGRQKIAAVRSSLFLVAQDTGARNVPLHKRSAVLRCRMFLIRVRNSNVKALASTSRQEPRRYDRDRNDIKNDLLVET
jgi:hypothetical protein